MMMKSLFSFLVSCSSLQGVYNCNHVEVNSPLLCKVCLSYKVGTTYSRELSYC